MSNRSRKAQVWIGVAGTNTEEARVLLFRVIDRRGGGWHPVTGGVEKEEDFEAGARRELREETGFPADSGRWLDLAYSFRFESRFGPAEEHAFGLVLPRRLDPLLDPTEHLAFEWVSVAEALRRIAFPSQRDALERFLCYLR